MSWIIGVGSMSVAILFNALTGPAFKYIENHDIQPSLAAAWRGHCMLFFLVPISIAEYLRIGQSIQYFDRKPDLPYQVYVHVIFAGLLWSGSLLFWINGLHFITVVRASLFINLHPLLMVFYLYFTGGELFLFDWCGVFLAIGGMILISGEELYGEFFGENDESKTLISQIFGSSLCFLAAFCEFGTIINRKKIKKYVPLMQYTAITTLIVTLVATVYSLLMENTSFHSSPSATYIFGWSSPFWRAKLIGFGFLNGVFCQAGFNFAMQYIDPLLFSALLLVTIPTTGFLSWALGIEGIPDKWTIIGGSVMLIGIGLITYSEHQRGKHPPIVQTTKEFELSGSNSPKNDNSVPTSPLSITSLIQLTPPQYSRLQQSDDDDSMNIHNEQI